MLRESRVTTRRQAIDILIDLAPDTESIQPALCRALEDEDTAVARDAARAPGALGLRAAPSVSSLIEALVARRRVRPPVRGGRTGFSVPPSGPGGYRLAARLQDPVAGVRWAACEGHGEYRTRGSSRRSATGRTTSGRVAVRPHLRTAGALGASGLTPRAPRTAPRSRYGPCDAQTMRTGANRIANQPASTDVMPVAAMPRAKAQLRSTCRRRSSLPPICLSTGTRRLAGTSPGASSWEPRP